MTCTNARPPGLSAPCPSGPGAEVRRLLAEISEAARAVCAAGELACWQWLGAVEAWDAAGRPAGGPAPLPGLAEPGGAERRWQPAGAAQR